MNKWLLAGVWLASGVVATDASGQTLKVTSNASDIARGTHTKPWRGGASHAHALLRGFSLNFSDTDHKIKAIGIWPGSAGVQATFADNDGNDRFHWNATFHAAAQARTFETSRGRCVATCQLPLAEPRPGEVFVLSGFYVQRNKDDSNVLALAIEPDLIRRRVSVTFRDRGTFSYAARVRYSYLPAARVEAQRSKSGSSYAEISGFRFRDGDTRGKTTVLQGFRMEFLNGDHYLKRTNITPQADGFHVRWMDKRSNHYDPWQVTLSYAILAPTAAKSGAVKKRPKWTPKKPRLRRRSR